MQIVQKRALSYQAQDLACQKCAHVKRTCLGSRCEDCAGPFKLRESQEKANEGLQVFRNLASHYQMSWLSEVLSFVAEPR